MQDWSELYLELGDLLMEKVNRIRWLDLWHNQVNFLSDEHPFPTPAVFLGFRILRVEDQGLKVQKIVLQVDTYIYYETFADTFRGSFNQGTAVAFLKLINDTYAVLHGSSGHNYSSMRRIGFAPVDAGGSGNLYQQSYEATLVDYAAQKSVVDGEVKELEIEKGDIDTPPLTQDPIFIIR